MGYTDTMNNAAEYKRMQQAQQQRQLQETARVARALGQNEVITQLEQQNNYGFTPQQKVQLGQRHGFRADTPEASDPYTLELLRQNNNDDFPEGPAVQPRGMSDEDEQFAFKRAVWRQNAIDRAKLHGYTPSEADLNDEVTMQIQLENQRNMRNDGLAHRAVNGVR